MITDTSSVSIYTDFQGFNSLRLKAQENSPEALKEVAERDPNFLDVQQKLSLAALHLQIHGTDKYITLSR